MEYMVHFAGQREHYGSGVIARPLRAAEVLRMGFGATWKALHGAATACEGLRASKWMRRLRARARR